MMPFRRADDVRPVPRPPRTPRNDGAGAGVLPLPRGRRYRGGLRRLQEAAPRSLRERIARELRTPPAR